MAGALVYLNYICVARLTFDSLDPNLSGINLRTGWLITSYFLIMCGGWSKFLASSTFTKAMAASIILKNFFQVGTNAILRCIPNAHFTTILQISFNRCLKSQRILPLTRNCIFSYNVWLDSIVWTMKARMNAEPTSTTLHQSYGHLFIILHTAIIYTICMRTWQPWTPGEKHADLVRSVQNFKDV